MLCGKRCLLKAKSCDSFTQNPPMAPTTLMIPFQALTIIYQVNKIHSHYLSQSPSLCPRHIASLFTHTHTQYIPPKGLYTCCLLSRYLHGHVFTYLCAHLTTSERPPLFCESPCEPKTLIKGLTSTLLQSDIHTSCWYSDFYLES